MLASFLYPYFNLLEGAAWSIQQSLDGLGLISLSFFGAPPGVIPPPTAYEWSLIFLIFLLLYFALLSVALLLSGYVLRRKIGLLTTAAVIALPGLMGVCDFWPHFSTVPSRYTLSGEGILGSPWGTGPLLFLGVLTGWSIALLAADAFRLRDGIWHLYDHIWYVAALVAGIFFVADAEVNENRKDLEKNIHQITQTSFYLLKQVELYDDWCKKNKRTAIASCQWASAVQYKLQDYAYSPEINFSSDFAPESTAQIYGGGFRPATNEVVHQIRTEIADFNRKMCPVIDMGNGFSRNSETSTLCKPTPPQLAEALTEPLDGTRSSLSPGMTVALASELLVPNFIRLAASHKNLVTVEHQNKRNRHFRWMYYIFFSLVVGGKIANSTAKLIDMSSRVGKEKSRTVHLVSRLAVLLGQGCKTLGEYVWRFLTLVANLARSFLLNLKSTTTR